MLLFLADRSGSRDLTMGWTILNIYTTKLLNYDACAGEFWTEDGFTLALFQLW